MVRSGKSRKIYSSMFIIPDGFEVHHLDLNKENDNIENLIAIPKELHREYHNFIMRNIFYLDLNILKHDDNLGIFRGQLDTMNKLNEILKEIHMYKPYERLFKED